MGDSNDITEVPFEEFRGCLFNWPLKAQPAGISLVSYGQQIPAPHLYVAAATLSGLVWLSQQWPEVPPKFTVKVLCGRIVHVAWVQRDHGEVFKAFDGGTLFASVDQAVRWVRAGGGWSANGLVMRAIEGSVERKADEEHETGI